jgi:glycine oxidase
LNTIQPVDYIIVGQGLAGSCLALQLISRNKRVVVIDRPDANSATRVAAGLFNPITGKNFTKTWLADDLFGYLHEFYQNAEHLTHSKFFHPMPLFRPFVSVEEQNEWMGRSATPSFQNYIDTVYTAPFLPEKVNNPLGGLLLKQCGFLNTENFLAAVREYVTHHGFLLEADFDEAHLQIEHDHVVYENFRTSKIIFCQGEKARHQKLFSWLPLRPLKGETLTLEPRETINTIFNRGVYVVPGIWKVGATYEARDVTPQITQKGFDELQAKLHELVNFPYQIIGQSWGFRPTTPDRRPILGPHPLYPSVILFNGLGTKGVSLAPYFSNILTLWLENNVPINKEVDIHRYKHYYYAGNPLR